MSKFSENLFHTTHLTRNIMEQIATRLELDIHDDEVSEKLYWICCNLESWPEDEGFGTSDSYSYTMEAREAFDKPLEEA